MRGRSALRPDSAPTTCGHCALDELAGAWLLEELTVCATLRALRRILIGHCGLGHLPRRFRASNRKGDDCAESRRALKDQPPGRFRGEPQCLDHGQIPLLVGDTVHHLILEGY